MSPEPPSTPRDKRDIPTPCELDHGERLAGCVNGPTVDGCARSFRQGWAGEPS